MFVEQFRKKIADWEISEETEIIPLGKNVWMPDYRLVHRPTGQIVMLDILGFWRRSSAERHLRCCANTRERPFIVAISDQLNVEEGELEGANVVPLPQYAVGGGGAQAGGAVVEV